MTDKKITDEEIIKALQCCSKSCAECDECPLYYIGGVYCYTFEIQKHALDLINRQKAEIERLKGSVIVNNIMESQKIKREALLAVKSAIHCQPVSNDMQEVVRCKDCKYLMFSDMFGECSRAHLGIVRPDDFCSYGERKENNDRS